MRIKLLVLAVSGLATTVAFGRAFTPPLLPNQTTGKNIRTATDITRSTTHRQSHVNSASSGQASKWTPEPELQYTAAPTPTDSTVPPPSSTPTDQVPSTPPGPASSAPTRAPTPTLAPTRAPTPAHPAITAAPAVILPPSDPAANIAPSPNFVTCCSSTQYDDSRLCVNATLQAIANARAAEGLGPMVLPANWNSLTPQEQLFVVTNLERAARGLEPLSAMVAPLDAVTQAAALADIDPSVPAGFGFVKWGANLAGGFGNPLEVIYFWMYDDGPGSINLNCTATNTSGCWGHRNNVLMRMSGSNLEVGVGYAPTAFQGRPTWTELLVEATQSASVDFSGQ